MKRKTPLRANPEKTRAFIQRGRGSLQADPEKTKAFVQRGREAGAKSLQSSAAGLARAAPERRRDSSRTPVVRKPAKRSNGRKATPVDWERFTGKRKRRCPVPGCRRRPYEFPHHVVYQQEVRRCGGDVSDPDNALDPCGHHHDAHHAQSKDGKLPLSCLRDENFAYAAALLGPAAHAYLRRRYSGEDPRLDKLGEIPAKDRAHR